MLKYVLRAASILKIQMSSRKFSGRISRSLFIEKKRFEPSNLADTVQPIPAAYSQLCLVGDDDKLRQVDAQGDSKHSNLTFVNTSREEA